MTDTLDLNTPPEPQEVTPPVVTKVPNFKLRKAMFKPKGLAGRNYGLRAMLPAASNQDLTVNLGKVPNVNVSDSDTGADWENVVREGPKLLTIRRKGSEYHGYQEGLESPDSTWEQGFVHNGRTVASGRQIVDAGNNMTGELATLFAIAAIGGGKPFNVQLPNSGFWMTFKTPPEEAFLDLLDEIRSDTVQFGRYTFSLALANMSSYTTERILRFAYRHRYDSTVDFGNSGYQQFLKSLDSFDIWSIYWAILNTRFPDGLDYSRGCVVDPTKCTHVEEGLLDLSSLQVINTAKMTTEMRSHMFVRTPKAHHLDKIEAYQKALRAANPAECTVTSSNGTVIVVRFKHASAEEHIAAGVRWYEELNGNLVDSVTEEDPGVVRNAMLFTRSKATALRQYAHYIDSFVMEDGIVLSDRHVLDSVMNAWSMDDGIRNGVLEGVRHFIDTNSLAIIGISNYVCPVCGTVQPDTETGKGEFTSILPIDMPRLFFQQALDIGEKISNR